VLTAGGEEYEGAVGGYLCDGNIAAGTETYPLAGIAEAWRRQASGSPGAKILVSF
jgi:hypothetical protein